MTRSRDRIRRGVGRTALGLATLGLGAGWLGAAAAHPGHSARLEHADHQIKADPAAAENYMQRAEIHCEQRRFKKAKADFGRAFGRAPEDVKLRLRAARAWLDAEQFGPAYEAAEIVTRLDAEHAQGWLLLALAASSISKHPAAIQAIDQSFAHTDFPDLMMFAHRARIQLSAGDATEAAVAGLYEGIVQLGPNVVLLELAIEAELARDRADASLALLSLLPTALRATPKWLLRRAKLEAETGDVKTACSTLQRVHADVAGLPKRRREQPWVKPLLASAHAVGLKNNCKN